MARLVAARDRPADLERRQLRQVDRHHRRCAADREPENDPAGHQEPETRREDHDQHAHEEHDREHDDRGAASDGVGDLSAEQGSDRGGEDQRADRDAQLQIREPELGLHRTFRAVGHPGVVTEQQATEAGDDRDEADPLAVRAGSEWGSVDSPMLVECVIGGLLRLQPLVVPQPSPLQGICQQVGAARQMAQVR